MGTLFGLVVWGICLMTQRTSASPFSTIDFSIFPNSVKPKGEKMSVNEVHDNLKKLEKRFNETLMSQSPTSSQDGNVGNVENRMKELQEQFEGIQSSAADDLQTKEQVVQLTSRLETLESQLSSASGLKSALDELQTTVARDAEKFKQDLTDLKSAKMATDQKVASVETKVRTLETQVQGTAQNIATIQGDSKKHEQDITSLKSAKLATDQKMASVETEVRSAMTQVQGTAQNIATIQKDVRKLKEDLKQIPSGTSTASQGGSIQSSSAQGRPTISVQSGSNQSSSSSSSTSSGPKCPSDYHFNDDVNICVKYFNTPLNKDQADQKCMEVEGGRLAVPNSPEILQAVQQYLRNEGAQRDVFIGGYYDSVHRSFWWSTDEKIAGPWCPNEPTTRPCVSLWKGKGFCLDDSWCHSYNPFVCQVSMETEEDTYY